MLKKWKKELATNLNEIIIVTCYECVAIHTAQCTGITDMYLSHKYTILKTMHVGDRQTPKTFINYIKLSSVEIADEIAAFSK